MKRGWKLDQSLSVRFLVSIYIFKFFCKKKIMIQITISEKIKKAIPNVTLGAIEAEVFFEEKNI